MLQRGKNTKVIITVHKRKDRLRIGINYFSNIIPETIPTENKRPRISEKYK